MKKILLLIVPLVFLAMSCKDDGDGPSTGYITSNLNVSEEQKLLYINASDLSQPSTATYRIFSEIAENDYPGRVISLQLFNNMNSPFFSDYSDSIFSYLGYAAPSGYIQGEQVDLIDPETQFNRLSREKPFVGVSHAITENDTAWIANVKIRFFDDTTTSALYVQSYVLGTFRAELNDSAVDMRQAGFPDLVIEQNNQNFWDRDVNSLADTAKRIITKGDPYFHENVLLYGTGSLFGKKVDEFNPFGSIFYTNDVLGTQSTAIKNFIEKPTMEPDFSYEINFVTILWMFNVIDGNWEYVNGYISK